MTPPPAVDGADWVVGRGVGPSWRAVTAQRADAAAAELTRAAAWAKGVPGLAPYATQRSISTVLSAPPDARSALLLFPAMDCWLSAVPACVSGERSGAESLLHFAYFQSFAAAAAVLGGGKPALLKVRLSADARFHATGTRLSLAFPKPCAGREASVTAGPEGLSGRCGDAVGRPEELPALAEGMWVEQDDPLVLQPIVMHGLVRHEGPAKERFVGVLKGAMTRMKEVDPGLSAEMADFLRLIVPLDNPKGHKSVSSSYKHMRGALCLSHSDDQLLQEETLIHEFCHQKANLLSTADPLLKPGQGGQVFYSPLRPDARRLWGLLLGAHAFVNVNRYLQRVLAREEFSEKERARVQGIVARRLTHVDDMLRTVSLYAELTAAGERFQSRLWREHAVTLHAALGWPAEVMKEGSARGVEHRAARAVDATGFHNEAAK